MSPISVGPNEDEPAEAASKRGTTAVRREQSHLAPADLFAGRSPDAWRAEYASAFEWDGDVGHEAVDE